MNLNNHNAEEPSREELLVREFIDSLRLERNYSAHTLRAYRTDLLGYLAFAERKGFGALEPSTRQLRSYLADLDQARYARKTINRRLSSLRSFFRWLNVHEYAQSGSVSAVRGPKVPKHLPHVLNASEIDRLFDTLQSEYDNVDATTVVDGDLQRAIALRNTLLFEFMYATGARVSEVANVKVSDIDRGSGQVKLFGKGSKERIVPLHDTVLRVLNSYMQDAWPLLNKKQLTSLFLSSRGNAMSADSIRKTFKQEMAAAGLDRGVSPHAMRHTFATDMLDGGADLRSVQELLGHSSLSTTQIYTHLTPERLKSAHMQAHPRA